MKEIIQNGLLNDIDIVFAEYICEKQNSNDPQLWMLSAMISFSVNNGDSAFNPEFIAGKPLSEIFNTSVRWKFRGVDDSETTLNNLTFPKLDILKLQKYSTVIGMPGEETPIIFDSGLFFINKFFNYEKNVADFIKSRVGKRKEIAPALKEKINELFPDNSIDGAVNWQKAAAILAICNDFLVISGGPGTGKTTTSGKILALLLKENPNLKIKMVAPTGKAADRLNESIRKFKAESGAQLSPEILEKIPEDAETIHRFTGIYMKTPRYSVNSPAPADLLLIDEASMVSLPLFAATFKSLRNDCKVILLGDKDQLMAVENGNVLNDITASEQLNRFSAQFAKITAEVTDGGMTLEVAPGKPNPLEDIAVQLEHSWRFDQHSGIGALSRIVNQAVSDTTEDEIISIFDQYDNIHLEEIENEAAVKKYISKLCSDELKSYKDAVLSKNLTEIFAQLARFRILCAVNSGPFGVHEINANIEKQLFPGATVSSFYHGEPIMITKNDYRLGVSNGDVGVIFRDEESGELKAFFPDSDGEFRKFNPSSLDEYTTAFAISIHKSQGSEFENVFIMLPPEESQILTKELIYTAVTRAKKCCTVIASPGILHKAAITKMQRQSGLQNQLK